MQAGTQGVQPCCISLGLSAQQDWGVNHVLGQEAATDHTKLDRQCRPYAYAVVCLLALSR